MSLRPGLEPVTLDDRDYSYHGTFRQFGAIGKPSFDDSFTVDLGITMPDQIAEGLPWGCTGETQTDNLVDEMAVKLRAEFTYLKTCLMEGHGPNQGCQLRTSLNSTQVYGVQKETETTDVEAAQHKGGQFYNIYDDGGLDWFDSIRDAIRRENKGASCGAPWFPTWSAIGLRGMLPMPTTFELETARKQPNKLLWHNFSCKGWRTIKGVPYLMIKSWQGKNYGDNGWVYMSRDIANTVFELRGAGIFIQSHARPEDIYTIKVTILETVLIFLNRQIGLLRVRLN